MGAKEDVQQKVLTMLTEGMGLQVSVVKGGMLRVEFNDSSTAVFIEVDSWGKDNQLVAVSATSPLLREVPGTPELFKWIATDGSYKFFGHVTATADESGTYFLRFRTTFRGEYLDEEELETLIYATHIVADEWDDELQKQFGGQRWSDPS
jgi:hypothetical protein